MQKWRTSNYTLGAYRNIRLGCAKVARDVNLSTARRQSKNPSANYNLGFNSCVKLAGGRHLKDVAPEIWMKVLAPGQKFHLNFLFHFTSAAAKNMAKNVRHPKH